ncbi:hypothetical protein C2E20_3736 [Micractinium conductrix]|uniref:Wax synthase domain-containing protein n=1 Tax=Micractinium conductrix TaxID=554055 RepID=A0A2P6VGG4_9CHLO|nr:hypothetical protein C2E20_3736 [Micractinium conductrix]|eukprot:PSC73168.1 hypothetical protein C2E20_3736 [Micractinium conductrix]
MLQLCCLVLAGLLRASAGAIPSNAGLKPRPWESVDGGAWGYFQLAPRKPKGTVLLIHGCGPGARAFFPNDPVHCPDCQGLPEYLSQTKQSLAQGYSVLVLQSADEGSGCLSSSTRDGRLDDRPRIIASVARFRREHRLTKLPLYVQGYSSGGTMLLKLPSYLQDQGSALRIDGIVSVDAAPRGGFNAEGKDGKIKRGLAYPPTLFVTMRLGGSYERAPAQIDFLRKNGVPADIIVSYPRKVGPTYFSDRIPGVTRDQSVQLVTALRALGGLAPDGSVVGWVLDAAAEQAPWVREPSLWPAVWNQLSLAMGNHENMGEFTAASLAWLERRGKANVKSLLRRLVPARPADVTINGRMGGAAAAAWLHACTPRLRPGAARLVAALPVLALCGAAPLPFRRVPSPGSAQDNDQHPPEIVTIVLVEFAFTWLCAFKVLAWACGRGPLAQRACAPLPFAAVMLAPITPSAEGSSPAGSGRRNGRQGEHAGGAATLAAAFGAKVLLVLAGLAALQLDPPLLAKEFLYTLGLYAVLSFVMDGPAALISALIGVRVAPHFDAPWRATSLAEFWSKRWDLAASNALRCVVYEPLLEGRLVCDTSSQQGFVTRARVETAAAHRQAATERRRRWRMLASAACFLVSGCMHEVQFLYMTGRTSGGLMLAFFTAQVSLIAFETVIAAWLRHKGWRVPAALRTAATLAVLLLVAHVTFWRACHRWGITQSSLESVAGGVAAAGHVLGMNA